jgi:uncharacterized protein YcfL
VKTLVALSLLLMMGCSSSEKNERHTVQCRSYVNRCHDQARDICTDGYLVTNRVRPKRNQNGDTVFTLNFRCRQQMMR